MLRIDNVSFEIMLVACNKLATANRNAQPLAREPFALSHQMTAKSLGEIGKIGGPRCCKRDSFLSILSAIDFAKENFDVEMERPEIICEFSKFNNQCIGKRCPFSISNKK